MQTNQWNKSARTRVECHRPIFKSARALFALFIFAAALFPSFAQSDLPLLFSNDSVIAADGGTTATTTPKGYKRVRKAKLNPQLLAGVTPLRLDRPVAGDAANLALNLFADRQLSVAITKTDYKSEGAFVSYGKVVGQPESTVILAVQGDVMAGTIAQPGSNVIQISYAGDGTHQIGEVAAEEIPICGNGEVPNPGLPAGDVTPHTAGDAAVVVDIMVVYTTAARVGAGGTAAMNALVDAAIAEANTCYSNSAVNLQLNLVYRGEINYTESGSASTDLGRLQSGSNSQLAPILTLRNTYGADVVTLVTESMATYAGLGYVMSPVSSNFAPYAFNVIRRQYFTGSYVLPHEVGHNMGCQHDRDNANTQGAFDYSYGYRFTASSTEYRTVMAYAPGLRIPYFSNPDVSYLSTATGVAAGATNSANNALSLSNAVPTVASFRSSSTFFNFDSTAVSAGEADGTVTLSVSLSVAPTNTMTVAYSTVAVSATAGSDYTAASGTLTFTNGVTNRTITVTLLNDSVVETNETFRVVLSSPAGGAVLGPNSSADVTIVDNDIGITMAASTASVSEDGTNVVLTVNRSGGLTNTVSVDYATADVTATAGSDYTNTSGTLTFTNGVTSLTITVPIIDDSALESNETFKVNLSNATGGATIISPTNTTVTIVENDASLAFTTNAVAVAENGTLTLTVTRAGGTTGTVTVDYLTIDGTATAGDDYTNTSGTLTFTNGVTSRTITVPLINDTDVEGDETFTVGLTNATGAVIGAYTNVVATIRDNDSIFNFSTNAVSGLENSAGVTLTVVRTGGTIGAATVKYAATNGAAISGTDFKTLAGTLSFAAGETNKTITVQFIDDTSVETNETFTVGLNTPTGEGSIGTNDVATVTILDNDSLVGFASSAISVDEANTNITLSVTRTGTLTLTNTIAYSFKGISAAANVDFRGTNGVLTFAPGDTNKTITVAILDDAIVETNETFQVILASPTGGALITGTNTATVTIVETDIGVAFASTAYSVAEDGTNVVLTVNRTGATNGTATVDYATADVTATAGSDYTNTSGMLTFTNGVMSQTITVPIINDSTAETNETFKVTLGNVSGGYILGSTNAVVTILEDDGVISLTTNAVSVSEVASNIVLTVTRSGGTNTSMTVDYATADGSATNALDYTSTSGTLTFAAGVKTATISVPLLNDSLVEGDENFTLSLSNAGGGATLGSVTNVTVTILDNDSVFAVGTNAITVAETAGTATITVLRTGGLVGAATVNYATTNNTATAGSDYTAATGTLSFAAGETNKTFTIKITNDTTYETNETFYVGLNTPTGEGTLSTNSVVTVTITDNDSTISWETNAVSVAESAGTVTLNVLRTGTLTLTNTIPYTFKTGSATAADFTSTNGTLTFLPGETNKTITAGIVNDTLVETNETFSVVLGTPTGGALLGGTNTVVVTITETDVGLTFAANTYSVSESGTNVVLTVNRTGATNGTVTVDYATVDVSATAGSDYTNTSGTLTFTNGVMSQTITVPIISDSTAETNETFLVTLSNPTGAYVLGSTNAVVTILEDDGVISLTTNAVSVSEAATNILLTVTRTGGTNTSMTVDYATADGTATNALDYTSMSGTLTFAAGVKTATISVPLLNDSLVEGDENFTLSLSNAGGGAALGSVTNVTVTILDNDSVFAVSTNAITVAETAGTASITVVRTGGLVGAATVSYATTNNTATAGSDYTAATGTLSFAAGETNKTFTIKITNDATYETNETFYVGLNTPTGEGTLSTNSVVTVTITDNDSTISWETNAVSVAESAGTVTLNVLRTGTLTLTNTVPYTFKTGSATAADFTSTNGTLTFLPGETNKTITAAIINDTVIETNETFTVVLGSPTGGAVLGGTNTVVVTITENDAGVAWLATSATVWENATNVTLTVKRSGDTTSTVTVDYATADLTALAGSDYTNTSGTLTFTNGVTTQTITVPIIEDSEVESNEKFKLTLTNPTGAVISGTNTAVVTILEDNSGFTLSATNYTGREGTNVIVTLTRLGNTNTSFAAKLLTAYTGAATNTDFTAVNTNLTFATGQMSLTYAVALSTDAMVDTNETFDVQIQTVDSGFVAVSPTNAVVTIIDNTGTLQFSTNAVSVIESATNVVLTVTRTGGTNNTLTVDYATADGTATAGADYTGVTNTLTFTAGQASKTISIPLTNDSTNESDETFTVTLSNPTGAVLGSTTASTVTIKDNDSTIAMATNAVTVAESSLKVTLSVTRTGGIAAPATVNYATTNGTATAGSDYTAASGTLTFAAGETNKLISIVIANDLSLETNETFSVVLSNPTADAVLSTNDTTVVTITDNDSLISFQTNAVTVAENAGTATLTLVRTGTLTLTNTIAYAWKPGTATKDDFTGTNGIVTFAPGDTNKTITVGIVNDNIVESTESFTVVLSSPTGGAAIGGTNTATITITEDDIGLGFSASAASVSEDATNLVLTINRTGNTNGTVTVDYLFTDITATNNVDYNGTNGSLSFTNGVTSLTVTVPIVNDSLVESNETFRVSLTNASGALLVTPSSVVVTIIEDDSSISFLTNATTVAETVTNLTVTVKRTGGTNSTVTVDYLTIDGAATAGSDYTSTSGTLTFTNGQTLKTISIPLTNDSAVEGDEDFSLSLTNISGTAAVLGSYTNLTVTILDNDSVISVLTNAMNAAEDVGSAVVTVRRTGGVIGTATVQYATANGTATAGSDYTAAIGTLTFKPGETNKTIAIKITNDTAAESDETLTLTLSNPTGEATLSTNYVTTITILDNDFSVGDVAGSVTPVTIASLHWDADGNPTLTISGPIGSYAIIDASSDLTTWQEIGSEPISTGLIQVKDAAAGDSATRFYRLRAPADNSVTQ